MGHDIESQVYSATKTAGITTHAYSDTSRAPGCVDVLEKKKSLFPNGIRTPNRRSHTLGTIPTTLLRILINKGVKSNRNDQSSILWRGWNSSLHQHLQNDTAVNPWVLAALSYRVTPKQAFSPHLHPLQSIYNV